MNVYYVVALIAACGCCVIAGLAIAIRLDNKEKPKSRYDGKVVINMSDPEKDIFRIELDYPVQELYEKDELKFTVVREG